MADPSRSPVAVRVIRPYATEDEFLAREPETLTRTTVILLGAQAKPQGVILRFELVLASGDPLLRGEGRVVAFKAATAAGDSTLTLRFTRLDARSKALVDRAAALRDAKTRGNAPPSNPDLGDSSPALVAEPTIVSRPQARPPSRRPPSSSASRAVQSSRGPVSAGPVTLQEPPAPPPSAPTDDVPPPSAPTDEVPATPPSSSTLQVAVVYDPQAYPGDPQADAAPATSPPEAEAAAASIDTGPVESAPLDSVPVDLAPLDSAPAPEPSIPLLEPSVPLLEASASNPDLSALLSEDPAEAPPAPSAPAASVRPLPPASAPTTASSRATAGPRVGTALPPLSDRNALLERLRERAHALPSETIAAILARPKAP